MQQANGQRCHQAASKIIQLATLWDEQHSLRFTPPTTTAIIYCAGTCFLLAAAQAASPAQSTAAFQKVYAALAFLDKIGSTWGSGRRQAGILRDMLNECAKASMELPAVVGDLSRGWETSPTASFQCNTAQGDEEFDAFIQSLLSQSTAPLGEGDFMTGLEGFL